MIDSVASGVLEAFGAIVVYVIMAISYDQGKQSGIKIDPNNKVSAISKALLVCIVLAMIYVSRIGTHTENCDDEPVRGACDIVTDYAPSKSERLGEFTYAFTILFVPYISGFVVKANKASVIS